MDRSVWRSRSAGSLRRSRSAGTLRTPPEVRAEPWEDPRSAQQINENAPASNEWESGVLDAKNVAPKPWSQVLASHVLIERDGATSKVTSQPSGPSWDARSEDSISSGIRLN